MNDPMRNFLTPEEVQARLNEAKQQLQEIHDLCAVNAPQEEIIDEVTKMRNTVYHMGIMLLHKYTDSYIQKVQSGEIVEFDQETFEMLVEMVKESKKTLLM